MSSLVAEIEAQATQARALSMTLDLTSANLLVTSALTEWSSVAAGFFQATIEGFVTDLQAKSSDLLDLERDLLIHAAAVETASSLIDGATSLASTALETTGRALKTVSDSLFSHHGLHSRAGSHWSLYDDDYLTRGHTGR